MDKEITADFTTLMRQAPDTAGVYFREAVRLIDREFGEGFAKKNPSLVAAFMQTAATDMSTSVIAKVFGSAFYGISNDLSKIANTIGSM